MRMRGAAVAALAALLVAVLASGGHPGAAKGTAARTDAYRIVLESDIERSTLAYTIRSDGSRLTPVLPPNRDFWPMDVSRDGRMIAYGHGGTIYVSRASGKGLRRVVGGEAFQPTFSPDGRRLAYTFGRKEQIGVIGTNGRGRRRLAGKSALEMEWSPDGKALAYTAAASDPYSVVINPLSGGRRILARRARDPKWSPDGRWIAYASLASYGGRTGVWLVQPDGRRRHRVAGAASFSWSPDGRILAVGAAPRGITLLGVDGRVLRRIRLPRLHELGSLAWGPGGRTLIFDRDSPRQVWTVSVDGRGLRRVTRFGNNMALGWTRLSRLAHRFPRCCRRSASQGRGWLRHVRKSSISRPMAIGLPSPSVRRPRTASTSLSGRRQQDRSPALPRAALVANGRATSASTTSSSPDRVQLGPAGVDAATSAINACIGSAWEPGHAAARDRERRRPLGLPSPRRRRPAPVRRPLEARADRLGPRAVSGGAAAGGRLHDAASGRSRRPVESVSRGLIAVRETDAVAVLDERGALVRLFPFAEGEVTAARLDGGRLVVARAGVIEAYDVSTGAGLFQQPMPARCRLVDVDGGLAVLLRGNSIMLLRLDDGRSRILTPGRSPVLAELEPAGLFYSYGVAGGAGRVAFLPRSEAEPAERT